MGLLPSSIRLFLQLHKNYSFKGPVLTLGNQEIWASYDDLVAYFAENNIPFEKPGSITPHTSRLFREDRYLSRIADRFVHAKVLFEMLGMQEYFDMDKFASDSPAILHDLNIPVPKDLQEKFSLILDGGTIEHIFDVRQVMDNVLAMLKPGGCIVHICSFNMDHGFYAMSPCFYFDFYKANGFGDFSCFILQINSGNILKKYRRKNPVFEYSYGMRLDSMIDHDKQVLVFFAARKLEKTEDLVVPIQGVFNPVTSNKQTQESFFDTKIPKLLRPITEPFRMPVLRVYAWVNRMNLKNRRRVRMV